MRSRLKSLQRLLSVQKDMHRLAEWRFAKFEHQLHVLGEEQKRLMGHLGDERLAAFTKSIIDRLKALDEAKARLIREREAQRALLLEGARRMGQVANATEAVADECRRAGEKAELDAAIDAALNRKGASFR